MPTNTDITQSGSASGSERPVVYLVNADGEQGTRLNLPLLLAPIWRWRWAVVAILALTVLAAGWIWTRPPEIMHQMVIRRGIISAGHFRGQLENIIIPGAVSAMDPDWRPLIKIAEVGIIDRTLGEGDDPGAPSVASDLSTLSFPAHSDAQRTAQLADQLRLRIKALAEDSAPLAKVEDESRRLALSQALSRAERAYQVVSDPMYVDAVRGEIDRDIALTEAGIRRQNAVHESLTKRYASLTSRMALLQNASENLLGSMDGSDSTDPGMAQVVADRVTSMRMELEKQIPAERVQLVRSLEEAEARVDQLEASMKQQRLQANTFDSDIAERQANAQMSIESASAALTKYQAQSAAKLVSQPLTIVEEFDLGEEPGNRLLITLGVLILGGLASLLSAYVLEAVRLARVGAMQG